jgi:acylphosphatase
MSDNTTERMIFSGRVQGVGFRYTAQSIARRHPVTGYVRNLPDGTVELVAQGKLAALSALVADLQGHFRDNIRRCQRSPVAEAETFEGFEIRI